MFKSVPATMQFTQQ